MIAFDLNCGNGHRFEGWFASSQDYDSQRSGGLLSCPVCDDHMVQKALSVPNVGRKGNQQIVPHTPTPVAPVDQSAAPSDAVVPSVVAEFIEKLAKAQSEMLKKSQWVGGEFAETARAIHYGEEADRLIHGETSSDEAKALVEEGITVAPLIFPVIPPTAKN